MFTDMKADLERIIAEEKARPRTKVELLAELFGWTEGELRRRGNFARWSFARFEEENKTPGMQERYLQAVEAGLDEDLRVRTNHKLAALLTGGPVALSGLSVDELAGLATETRLRSIARDYDPKVHGGRLVCGPTGVGKSVTGVAVLRRALGLKRHDLSLRESEQLNERQREGFLSLNFGWVRAFDLPNARLANALGKGEAELVDRATSVSFLVLDDLGWESRRAGADDVVAEVIAARYDAGKPTYATTGLRLEQFEERYGSAVIRRLTEAGVKGKVIDLWPRESNQ